MPRFVGLALTTLCIALLAAPGAALAARGTVPPGVSGASQYTESLPGAGGEESTKAMVESTPADRGEGGGKGGAPAGTLGTEDAEKLEALGPEGKAAAGLAAAGTGGGNGGTGDGVAGTASGSSGGGSGVAQVVGRLSGSDGSGGMGLLLPLLIAMAVIAAAGYLIGRRRVFTHEQP